MRRRRVAIMREHKKLVEAGMLKEAQVLQWFLDHGHIILGRDEVSWNVGILLGDIGCRTQPNYRTGAVEVWI